MIPHVPTSTLGAPKPCQRITLYPGTRNLDIAFKPQSSQRVCGREAAWVMLTEKAQTTAAQEQVMTRHQQTSTGKQTTTGKKRIAGQHKCIARQGANSHSPGLRKKVRQNERKHDSKTPGPQKESSPPCVGSHTTFRCRDGGGRGGRNMTNDLKLRSGCGDQWERNICNELKRRNGGRRKIRHAS